MEPDSRADLTSGHGSGWGLERYSRALREARQLILDHKDVVSEQHWLKQSFKDPEEFYSAIFTLASESQGRAMKSKLFVNYDLFYDILLRNTAVDQMALKVHKGEHGWEELSYGELVAKTTELARHWLAAGVLPGHCVCLCLPLGADWLVAALTTLRLGMVLSYLPPEGDYRLQQQLSLLEPDHVVIEPLFERLLGPFEQCVLEMPKSPSLDVVNVGSHTYDPRDEVFRLLPCLDSDCAPRSLTAGDALLPMLRDLMQVFELRPGDHFVFDFDNVPQYMPLLPLTVLASGATIANFTEAQFLHEPELVWGLENKVMPLHNRRLDQFLQSKQRPQKTNIKLWLRNPAEGFNYELYKAFFEEFQVQEVPGKNVVYDSAYGGSILFSVSRSDAVHYRVQPSPGLLWQLSTLPITEQPTLNPSGAFTELSGIGPRSYGSILLNELGHEWLYLGHYEPRRNGWLYPSDQVVNVVTELSFVKQASVVDLSPGFGNQPSVFNLLVFVGGLTDDELEREKQDWLTKVQDTIANRLGARYLPDKVVFTPFHARQHDGIVDDEWCKAAFRNGELQRRMKNKAFRRIAYFRDFSREIERNLPKEE